MTYQEWFENHANKHKQIVSKLITKNFTKEQIIEYFDFENMVKQEKDFCLLYADNKKCHEMESLNCYLCACPYFRFDDAGIKKVGENTQYSFCDIESKDGSQGVYSNKIHQDCSNCTIPHHKKYIEKNFDLDWKVIMQKCAL